MTTWAILAGAAAISYALRAVLILRPARRPLPPLIEQAGPYIGPAMGAGLAASALAPGTGAGGDPARLVAVAAAAVVAWRGAKLGTTVAVGLGVCLVATVVLP